VALCYRNSPDSRLNRLGSVTWNLRGWGNGANRQKVKSRLLGQCLFEGIRVNAKHQTRGHWRLQKLKRDFCTMSPITVFPRALVADPSHCDRQKSQWTHPHFLCTFPHGGSRDSVVGIATRNGLDGPEIEFQLGAKFPAPVQTAPVAHPTSYTKSTGFFLGVKRPERCVDHTLYLAPRLKKE